MKMKISELVMNAVTTRERVEGAPHDFYKYPARFSPIFARELIRAFTKPGELVLDPFCGGGTTIVEAIGMGRRAIGMDVSTLATFLTETKTTPISNHDIQEILKWVDLLNESQSSGSNNARIRTDEDVYYQRNLPDEARVFFDWVLGQLALLPKTRQQNFARLILLSVGQWGLDCKTKVPSCAEFKIEFCNRLRTKIVEFYHFLSEAAAANKISRAKISSLRHVINGSSEGCGDDSRIPKTWLPAKLVLTSPPYPGVHMVYHRWQINGRKETPAPFWLANQRDGAGESHYILGPRGEDELVTYYTRLKKVFSSVKMLLDKNSIVAQLVAFSAPEWQLPAYLHTMKEAGFSELEAYCESSNFKTGRIWRNVPGRKWYANTLGTNSASKEVLLLHKIAN